MRCGVMFLCVIANDSPNCSKNKHPAQESFYNRKCIRHSLCTSSLGIFSPLGIISCLWLLLTCLLLPRWSLKLTFYCTLKCTHTLLCVYIHLPSVGEYIRRLENMACRLFQNILWIFLQCMNWSIAGLSVGIWSGYCAWIIWTDSHAGSQTSQQMS